MGNPFTHPLGNLGYLASRSSTSGIGTWKNAQLATDALSPEIRWNKLPQQYITLGTEASSRVAAKNYGDERERMRLDFTIVASLDTAQQWNHVPDTILEEALAILQQKKEGAREPEERRLLEALSKTKKWRNAQPDLVAQGIEAARKSFPTQTEEDRKLWRELDNTDTVEGEKSDS